MLCGSKVVYDNRVFVLDFVKSNHDAALELLEI